MYIPEHWVQQLAPQLLRTCSSSKVNEQHLVEQRQTEFVDLPKHTFAATTTIGKGVEKPKSSLQLHPSCEQGKQGQWVIELR